MTSHRPRIRSAFALVVLVVLLPVPAITAQEAERISTSWYREPLGSVLVAFAEFTGKSVIPPAGIDPQVTVEINDQPWDVALQAILRSLGLYAEEDEFGIVHVLTLESLAARRDVAPLESRAYRLSFVDAAAVAESVRPVLSARGSISVSGNALVVSDLPELHPAVEDLLAQVDVEMAQVSIQARIVFVNRTRLNEMGLSFELTEPETGAGGANGDDDTSDPGPASPEGENSLSTVPDAGAESGGQPGVSLGGNSIAALGNAASRIASPALRLLATLVLGRYSLDSFLDLLEAEGMSEIEAEPRVTTLDGHLAEIHVGEVTPIRTIDVGSGGDGTFPTAQVSQEETGIILRATPRVTADGGIVLDLEAERSAAEPAASDVGYIVRTQRARTRVLVEDGGTVVIAGLTQRERVQTLSGIPLLMDVPLIGRLFRVSRNNVFQRDLVILVTPTIVGRGEKPGSEDPVGNRPTPLLHSDTRY